MPVKTGSTASSGATSPDGSDRLSYKKGVVAQRESLLRRLTLLARLDQTNEQLLPQFQMATGEIGYADRRLGGASVWFIHNPNAISIQYTYLVNVQQLVFHGTPRPSPRRSMHERNSSAPSR